MLDRLRGAIKGMALGAARGYALSNSGLEAGRFARRLSGWLPSRSHINTLISSSGRTTLARARFLVRNNPYGAGAVECFAANTVGAGIVPSWVLAQERKVHKQGLQDLWKRWTDEADADGVSDLYGMQRRIAREYFIAGECFLRKRPRYLKDGLSVPLQLQMLPSEMCPVEYTMPLDNGNWLRQGIEFDAIGRRVAYHFWRAHPGDMTDLPKQGQITIVPASEVLHIFDPVEAGQVRGLSRLTPAIVSLWMLDGYDDAEMERKKTAALFCSFITRLDPTGELFDKAKEDAAKAGDGNATVTLEPGGMRVLLPGEDIKSAAPADVGPNYEAFQYRQLTRICAALGLPYAGVTSDMMRANYSNTRAALLEMRRRVESFQHGVMVFQGCRPIANWWLAGAALANAIDLPGYVDRPGDYRNINWIPPRWDWVDPLKDRQAEVIAVDAGFKARSHVIEAEGMDAAEVDARIAEDQERAKALGIIFSGTGGAKALVAAAPPDENSQPADPQQTANTADPSKLNGHSSGPAN